MSRFHGLNYSLANEDTAFELAALGAEGQHVVVVSGSGSRFLPLLARFPKRVTCVDVSEAQLLFARLRVQSLLSLTHPEFLAFWGHAPFLSVTPDERKTLFRKIEGLEEAQVTLFALFQEREWRIPLYYGRWETGMAKRSHLIRRVLGSNAEELFAARTADEHREWLSTRFPWRRWRGLLEIAAAGASLAARLKPAHFPRQAGSFGFSKTYRDSFERLVREFSPRANFLLQMAVLGRVRFAEGNLCEADPALYEAMREGARRAIITYHALDIIEAIKTASEPVDFVSFSNVPSYFSTEKAQRFLSDIRDRLSPRARVVIRTFLSEPLGSAPEGYHDLSSQFASQAARETTQQYRIEVFERSGEAE